MSERHLPEATVARLPRYLQVLLDAAEAGTVTLSSDELAAAAGMTSAKVRKDLSYLGSYGTRGVGYRVPQLAGEISVALGLTVDRPVAIVGIGNLGRALASYGGFNQRGFRVVALLDADAAKVGTQVGDRTIEPIDDLEAVVADREVSLVVLATPAGVAQELADRLVAAGVGAVLNFAPTHLSVPDTVAVRTVDLATELQILAFYEQGLDGVGSRAG